MALESKQVAVRLPAEAHAALALMADSQGRTYGDVAGEILARALLGVAHEAIVAAERYSRSVKER